MTHSAAEALAADIDHLKQALHAACDGLDAVQDQLAAHETANPDELAHPEGIGESMAALAHQVALEADMTAGAALGQAMDAAGKTATRVLEHVDAGSTELGHAHDALDALLAAAAKRLAQAGQDIEAAQEAALERADGILKAAFEALRVALDATRNALTSELAAAGTGFQEAETGLAGQVLPAFDALLSNTHAALVTSTAASAGSSLGAAVTGLDGQLATQALQFDQLAMQLREQVCQGLAHCMDETVSNLKHQVTDRVALHLTREVTQTIMEAEIGQQLTAAIAPVLPEMVAVYKASEAIKIAIRALRDPLGEIGEVIKI